MKKRILAICLACIVAISMAACGDSEDSSKKSKKSDDSAVSQINDSKSADDSKDTDESKGGNDSKDELTDSSEDENKTETVKDDKYAYYDLLDAEYQKYGRCLHFDSSAVADGYTFIADNNGSNPFQNVESFKKPCLLIKEDGSSVDLRKLDIFKDYNGYIGEGLQYASGYLYKVYTIIDGNDHFVKIDMNGKVVKDVDLGSYKSRRIEAVSGNGDAIISDSGKKYILKNDSDKLVEMPPLNLEGEHGISIEASRIEFIYMFYKSRVYVWAYDPNNNESMHYFDFDDLSWHECEKLVDKYNSLYQCRTTIGRYAFLDYDNDYKVYDMETNTVTDKIPYAAGSLYFGGDSNIDMENFKWREIKLSLDGKDKEVVKELAEEKLELYVSSVYYMSKTHYLYQDKYGLFVRSFEKGKDDEKAVLLFENQ
ncbi:MAG: hypothetical protein IJ170_00035 [Ruminococcus sp.]|nr:hypothetical protein [Ruminococcus sp.]